MTAPPSFILGLRACAVCGFTHVSLWRTTLDGPVECPRCGAMAAELSGPAVSLPASHELCQVAAIQDAFVERQKRRMRN